MTQRFGSRSPFGRAASGTAAIALFALVGGGFPSTGLAQGPASARRSPRFPIPYLANVTRPTDLDFAAAECDVASSDEQMTCRFRQVFLTLSSLDPTSCVITTNGYEQTFRREASTRWVSRSAPVGSCGVVETTILEDGGSTRWTMTISKASALKGDRPECRAAAEEPAVYDWRAVKRKLPCSSIQPGAIER
jgi:hypothetical protein